MVAAAQGLSGDDPWAAIEQAGSQALAAARHRRVEDTLREVPRRHAQVLMQVHAVDARAWPGWKSFGEAAGAVQLTERFARERGETLEQAAQAQVAHAGAPSLGAARKRVQRDPATPTPEGFLVALLARAQDPKALGHKSAAALVRALKVEAQELLELSERYYLDAKAKVRARAS